MKKSKTLTPRQSTYLQAYADRNSASFGNAFRSALSAGYSEQTARNMNHLQPDWLSENIGQIGAVIQPEELMQQLTDVIRNEAEPTIIRLKATELAMKAYSMTKQRKDGIKGTVNVNIDLTS